MPRDPNSFWHDYRGTVKMTRLKPRPLAGLPPNRRMPRKAGLFSRDRPFQSKIAIVLSHSDLRSPLAPGAIVGIFASLPEKARQPLSQLYPLSACGYRFLCVRYTFYFI